jgi:hypothetical protein
MLILKIKNGEMIRVRMKKQLIVLLLIICLVFILSSNASAQSDLGDVSNHWAEQVIGKWVAEGVVSGYPDGTFQPNRQITRAEFITIINKALGCSQQANVSFSDVKDTNWFYVEVAKAVKSGYIKGYEDGTFKPNNPISRQEAAVVFARIMCLSANKAGVAEFTDGNSIPSWSKGMVGAVIDAGYMGGYPDKTFQPTRPITRAESLVTLDRVIGELYNEEKVFGPETGFETMQGNVTISVPGATLQNTIVEGNLYLTEGIGEGTVILKNVTVKGTTIVRGGGINSVIMYNFNGETVVVDVPDGSSVRLVAQGTSAIGDVVFESDGILEEEDLTGEGFIEVIIPAGAEVVLNGSFDTVDIQAPSASVQVEGGTINSLTVSENADNVSIHLAEGSSVTNLAVHAPAAVTGTGAITSATVTSTGVTIDQTPDTVNVSPGVTSTVGGNEVTGEEDDDRDSGGGGGGGDERKISITAIEAVFSDSSSLLGTITGATCEIEIPENYADNVLFKGVKISGNYVEGAKIAISEITIAEVTFGSPIEPIELVNRMVTTRDLLGNLDSGEEGINLADLKEIGQIKIKGQLEKPNYTKSDVLTVVVTFSDTWSPVSLLGVENEWIEFSKDNKVITGRIKPGKEATPLEDVEPTKLVWTGTVKINGQDYTGEAEIKAAIVNFVAGATEWGDVTLGDLVDLEIVFMGYTLDIVN